MEQKQTKETQIITKPCEEELGEAELFNKEEHWLKGFYG